MVSTWHKAVFAWSFGMVWGFIQAVVQTIYRNFFFDRFADYKKYEEPMRIAEQQDPEFELTKEEEESMEEQLPTSKEGTDDEWVTAARFYEEHDKCDVWYRRAEDEYLEVMRNTAPDDPIRERYKPKPYPTKEEVKQSFYRHNGMFTN